MKKILIPCFLLFSAISFAVTTNPRIFVSVGTAQDSVGATDSALVLFPDTIGQIDTLFNRASPLIDSLFVSAPRDVLPMLDRTARLDLLDLEKSGLKAEVENIYGGRSSILEKSRDELLLRTSEVGEWEMKVLPASGEAVIFIIRSVTASGKSSRLNAYSTLWRERKLDVPRPPRYAFYSFPASLSPDRRSYYRSLLDVAPVKMSFLNTDNLFLMVDTEGMALEDKETVGEFCKPLVYEWTGEEFRLRE